MSKKVYLFKAAPETNDSNLVSDYSTTGSEVVEHTLSQLASSSWPTGFTKEDPFITLLTKVGVKNELIPVLAFHFSNLSLLWEHLKRPSNYAGIIFTSPRCVQSLCEAIRENDEKSGDSEWSSSLRDEWASKKLFCVGPSTVQKCRELVGPEVEGVVTGRESNGESLADKIIQVNSETLQLPLLYPCGSKRRDVVGEKLGKAGIKCEELVVYETGKCSCLEERLETVKKEVEEGKEQVYLCFFSPSGVNYVMEYLEPSFLTTECVQIVAVGPTTKAALEKHFRVVGVEKDVRQCKDPTPNALVDEISRK